MKIELRNLFSKELNLAWDDPLPDAIRKRWITILQIAKSVEHIRFRRCVKPDAPVVGKPTLIVCNDASTEAMCATAHIRWQLEDGSYQCFLYSSKTRVAPLQKESVPRLEMQSAVMAVRLSKSIITHTNIDFEEITHVLDSKCTLATLLKDTVALKEYMGNRVSEALQTTSVKQWVHIASKLNISDLGTRTNARVEDVSESSDWQCGTDWMRQPKSKWPVTQDVSGVAIPSEELVNKAIVAFACSLNNTYNVERFRGRTYIFLLRVTAVIITVLRQKSFSFPEITTTAINDVEKACIKSSMRYTKPQFDAGNLKSLGAQVDDNGIINVVSRAASEMESHYGSATFPILM